MAPTARNISPANPDTQPVIGVAKAAGIISLGNVASRLLGLAREFVKADLFGATGLVSAFEVANIVPTMIFDLLVGGMISSALVPVLSDLSSAKRNRDEFWQLISGLLSLAAVCLAAFVVLAELLAPQITWLFGARNFDDPALWPIATDLLRVMLPAVLFLNLAGLLTGALYSLKRFTLPALTAAAFNACVVMAALLRPDRIDSLAWGVLAGSIIQVMLQLPRLELRRLRWRWNPKHPSLVRIIRLYIPIVLGVMISQIAIAISYNLATRTGDESVAIMRYATTLIQFPLGLIATAVSIAILPTLAQEAAVPKLFKTTLVQGLRLVIVLTIPATVGLFVLARPIVTLAFEHGDFLPAASEQTTLALRYYLLGLPFAAVDQLLIFAFYARKNTRTPAMVGVFSVGIYLIVALALLKPMGLFSLMLSDSIKHMLHAGAMTALLIAQIGKAKGDILLTIGKASMASAIMGMLVWIASSIFPTPGGLLGRLVAVAACGGIGLITYTLVISRLQVPEMRLLADFFRSRTGQTGQQ